MGMVMRGSHSRRGRIDVTPLVDIVLVLLILFLVTTPVTMKSLSIEVPEEGPSEPGSRTSMPIQVSVRADGSVTIVDRGEVLELYRIELANKLQPRLAARHLDRTVVVDLDPALPYSEAVSAMDTIRGVGAEKIALATHGLASRR